MPNFDKHPFVRPVRRNEPMTLPWVVVGPKGVYYVGLHNDELGAWTVALGWPDAEEIAARKAEGWYAAQATMTWTHPNTKITCPSGESE